MGHILSTTGLHYTRIKSHDLCLTIDMAVVNDYISYFSYFRQTVYFSFLIAHCQITWQCYVTDLEVPHLNGKGTW